jgi:putative ABC transport system permease protein
VLLVDLSAGLGSALPARRHVLSELAQAGMRDGVRRTATTAGPVIVLFGLVVRLFGILATQTVATRIERVQQSSADLVVVSEGDVGSRIRAVPGVALVDAETEVSLPVQVPRLRGGWAPVDSPAVTAVDPSAYARLTHQPLLAGHLSAFGPGRAVLGPSAPEDGLGRPRIVRVDGVVLPVVARIDTTIAGGADVVVDRDEVPTARLEGASTTTFVKVADGESVAEVRRELDEIASVSAVSTVPVWAESLANEQARENDGVMAALAGLGGLYAFLSLVNAVAIGTAQRRREFAVLRVTGASRPQVVASAALESLGVGAIGVVLGSVVVVVCLMGVRHGIAGTLGVAVLEMPWALGLALAAASLAASAGTAAAAAWSVTRTTPVGLVAARE